MAELSDNALCSRSKTAAATVMRLWGYGNAPASAAAPDIALKPVIDKWTLNITSLAHRGVPIASPSAPLVRQDGSVPQVVSRV